MLNKRLITASIIIPVSVVFIVLGGWFFTFFVSIILAISAWEYWQIYHKGGYSPNLPVLLAGVIALTFSRYLYEFRTSDIILTISILAAMAFHTFNFELGKKNSSVDFGITLGGILYIGWLGSYLISLRNLPDGLWWTMLVIPAVALGDSGAYFIGTRFGKNKIIPRVSPNKTWEGYIGGVLFSALGGAALGFLWNAQSGMVTATDGIIIGAVVGILTPIGDLGESMLKRQFNIKDSSNLLPGHGGFLDRIDSWLWAACISYYVIIWFV